MKHSTETFNSRQKAPKGKWGLVIKIILTVASAIAGAFGITACAHQLL